MQARIGDIRVDEEERQGAVAEHGEHGAQLQRAARLEALVLDKPVELWRGGVFPLQAQGMRLIVASGSTALKNALLFLLSLRALAKARAEILKRGEDFEERHLVVIEGVALNKNGVKFF